MKNKVVVLSLAMALFSFQAKAASLSWVNTPSSSSTVSVGGSDNNLFGSRIGLTKNVVVNDSWEFLVSAAGEVVINISSLIVIPTWLTSVTLNGEEINQSGCSAGNLDLLACTNGAWLFKGNLSAGAHVIALTGLTNGKNSGYQINVESDDEAPTPAPVPGAIWLFAPALAALFKTTRRGKSA